MSVSKLAEGGFIQPADEITDSLPGTAICFAFDSGYLMPFKVMLYSMACAGALPRDPIIVLSDDPAVFEDPIVNLVVDHPVLLQGKVLDTLYGLARDNVERPERAAWNKGTFLKWAAFDDHGYENILFLDVDMLVLKPLAGLADLKEGADLLAAPQFQTSLYRPKGKGRYTPETVEQNLRWMMDGEFAKAKHRRMNSGVMLLGSSTASPAFQDELVAFAAARKDLHEQAHLTAFFAEHHEWKLRLIPSAYNFQERYLGKVALTTAIQLLSRIAILHFAGRKPWETDIDPGTRLSTLLWWNFQRAADEAGLLDSSSE
jgi:lipopolysaccharide biosynthesis glycosyltransferase